MLYFKGLKIMKIDGDRIYLHVDRHSQLTTIHFINFVSDGYKIIETSIDIPEIHGTDLAKSAKVHMISDMPIDLLDRDNFSISFDKKLFLKWKLKNA